MGLTHEQKHENKYADCQPYHRLIPLDAGYPGYQPRHADTGFPLDHMPVVGYPSGHPPSQSVVGYPQGHQHGHPPSQAVVGYPGYQPSSTVGCNSRVDPNPPNNVTVNVYVHVSGKQEESGQKYAIPMNRGGGRKLRVEKFGRH
jgi:hypothetical protein